MPRACRILTFKSHRQSHDVLTYFGKNLILKVMNKNILFTQKAKKYQGKSIAVVKNHVVASGKTAKESYELAKKILGTQKVEGIYYVPQKKDLLTALCVFHTIN